MSGLRSVIEQVTEVELASMSPDDLTAEAAEVARAIDMLNYRLASLTDEVRRRGIHELQGFVSVTR